MTSQRFRFKAHDIVGENTLETIGKAKNFNRWIFEKIRPWCKGNILELGSGTGNISEFFVEEGRLITLSDIRESYCMHLKNKFPDINQRNGIKKINIEENNIEDKFPDLVGKFDTIFAINVLEHIEDDHLVIENCKKLLCKGGHLVILVPAFEKLYNRLDFQLEHFRRYSKKSLKSLFSTSDLEVLHESYFNAFGILGWFTTGNVLKNNTIPGGQMAFFNQIVPLAKFVDLIAMNKLGLSLIMIGKK